jgi:hypothetical protein
MRGPAILVLAAFGCGSSSKMTPMPEPDAAMGIPVCGMPVVQGCWLAGRIGSSRGCTDSHCLDSDGGVRKASVEYASCRISPETVLTTARPDESDGALGLPIEADDDGCSFHMRMVPHCSGGDRQMSLDLQLSSLTTGTLITGAKPYVDAFASPTHIATTAGTTTEPTPGHYRIEPIVFDTPGPWTVTVHFFGTCPDVPHGPHGHSSLLVDVP